MISPRSPCHIHTFANKAFPCRHCAHFLFLFFLLHLLLFLFLFSRHQRVWRTKHMFFRRHLCKHCGKFHLYLQDGLLRQWSDLSEWVSGNFSRKDHFELRSHTHVHQHTHTYTYTHTHIHTYPLAYAHVQTCTHTHFSETLSLNVRSRLYGWFFSGCSCAPCKRFSRSIVALLMHGEKDQSWKNENRNARVGLLVAISRF